MHHDISIIHYSRSISLETLCKGAILGRVGFQVSSKLQVVTQSILGGDTTRATSRTRRDEEGNVWDSQSSNSDGTSTDNDQVHDESTFFIDVKLFGSGVQRSHSGSGIDGRRGESTGGSSEKGKESGNELHGC